MTDTSWKTPAIVVTVDVFATVVSAAFLAALCHPP